MSFPLETRSVGQEGEMKLGAARSIGWIPEPGSPGAATVTSDPGTTAIASISIRKSGWNSAWTPTHVLAGGLTPEKNCATRVQAVTMLPDGPARLREALVERSTARPRHEVQQPVEDDVSALVLVEPEMDEVAQEARWLREPEAVCETQPAGDGIRRARIVRRRVAEKRDEVAGRSERDPGNHRVASRIDEVVEASLLEGRACGQQANRPVVHVLPAGGPTRPSPPHCGVPSQGL
jgi:hypothetical protein